MDYKTVKDYCNVEIIIDKSKFICHINKVNNDIEAKEFINKIKKEHWNANHNCYAYIIGENSNIQKSSDDGEPSGTAGVPILETLKKNELTNVVCVVTRYFGGIKLGAGGLIRAYSKSASSGINNSIICNNVLGVNATLEFGYNFISKIDNIISTNNVNIVNKEFHHSVVYTIETTKDIYEVILGKFQNATNGSIDISNIKDTYIELPM